MGGSWSRWLAENQISDAAELTMRREWGPLLYIGAIFLNLDSRFAAFSVSQAATFITVIILNVYVFLMSAAKTDSLTWFAQYLNFVSLGLIGLGVLFGGLLNRNCIIRLLEILSTGFYSYGDSFDIGEVVVWKKSLRKFKIILIVGIPLYLSAIALSIMLKDFIDQFLGFDTPSEDYVGEIYQSTPVPVYYPFVVSNWFLRVFAVAIQVAYSGILAVAISVADIMMLFLGQDVALEMRTLCMATVKLDERAKKMYEKIMGGRAPPTDPLERRRDRVLDECYRRAIKQIIEHHYIIQEFFHNYNVLAKWPSFLAVLNGSILIAMSASVILAGSDEGDVPSTFISGGLLLVAEVLSIWLLCETGEQVAIWSERTNDAMYEFKWLDVSASNKKMLLIFKEKAKNPLVMKAGGLTPINRNTYGTIMNSAYSYVNLLRASASKN